MSPGTGRRSRCSRMPRESIQSVRASDPRAPEYGWSCRSSAARRSTSSPGTPEPARFIAKALSPARVREVLVDDDSREATVIVPDDQLSLAIGKEGLNARLAARLTGWKVDIQSERQFAEAEAEAAYAGDDASGEEYSGRCSAVLSTGKRCPNAAVPGSRYCGIPAHQELALPTAADVEPDRRGAGAPSSRLRRTEGADPSAESIGPESRRACQDGEGSCGGVTEPIRSCVGCGRKAPKAELLRFVASTASSQPSLERACPGAARTPAGDRRASSAPVSRRAFARTLRRPCASFQGLCRPSTPGEVMAERHHGSNRPKRPLRPRQGSPGGKRKRRVVIDQPRHARRRAQARNRGPAEGSARGRAPVDSGPVRVASGVDR